MKNLSILPTRRRSGPAYYEPNYLQVRSAVKPSQVRHKKPPVWVAVLMFLSGVVGLIGLMVSIYE